MPRNVRLPLLCVSLAVPAIASGAKASWAQPEIKLVTARGLMGGNPATFKPDSPLTQGTLAELVAGLTEQEPAVPLAPEATVTMTALDASLVKALGLGDAAAAFTRGARHAGLAPPGRFGNEVGARLLRLRTTHPAGQDSLELLPKNTATRAETAFSAARILGSGEWEAEGVRDAALTFELPDLSARQPQILRTAVSFIGFPYIWGGTSEKAQTPLGFQTPGGFDCSGFVWRVFQLQAYPGAPKLSEATRGRP